MFVLVSFDPLSKNKNIVFTSSYKDHLQKICDQFNKMIDGTPQSLLPKQIVLADKRFTKDSKNLFYICIQHNYADNLRLSFAADSYLAIYEVPNV